MTDTNQASELYELCEKVYELTGWNNQELLGGWIQDQFDGPENRGTFTTRDQIETILFKLICPLYTSDYLLEKLQSWFYDMGANDFGQFGVTMLANCCIAKVRSHDKEFSEQASADTLLLALLKLTIALSEAGELK